MVTILGIDPGLRHTGWGVINSSGNSVSFISCGVIKSNSSDNISTRLRQIHDGIIKIADLYNPYEASVEETFVNKNNASSLKLGQARGAILLTLGLRDIVVCEYSANFVKKSVVGVGHADKNQVAMMVKRLLPESDAVAVDASDALAVAICHAHRRDFNNIKNNNMVMT
ncbi:MAG: crossover junction endodeoxyribonuclease RuvC [Rickettsiales bacterium]